MDYIDPVDLVHYNIKFIKFEKKVIKTSPARTLSLPLPLHLRCSPVT